MPTKEELRQVVRCNLNEVISRLNAALRGEDLAALESTLTRLGRGGQLPHWYQELQAAKTLPNLDGKTVGSVVELLLAAVLETALGIPPLRINPAHGVDLPDLDWGSSLLPKTTVPVSPSSRPTSDCSAANMTRWCCSRTTNRESVPHPSSYSLSSGDISLNRKSQTKVFVVSLELTESGCCRRMSLGRRRYFGSWRS
jgi:hypothetical protein